MHKDGCSLNAKCAEIAYYSVEIGNITLQIVLMCAEMFAVGVCALLGL